MGSKATRTPPSSRDRRALELLARDLDDDALEIVARLAEMFAKRNVRP